MWIGADDLETQGTWVWGDGTDFDFEHWKTGQPDNHAGQEHCLNMWKTTEVIGDKWNDVICSRPNPFMCKMPAV